MCAVLYADGIRPDATLMSDSSNSFKEISFDELVQQVDEAYRAGIREFWEDPDVRYLVVYFHDSDPADRELVSVGDGLEFATLEEASAATIEGKPARLYIRGKHTDRDGRRRILTRAPFAQKARAATNEEKTRLEKAIAELEERLTLLKRDEHNLMTRVQELMVSEMEETRKKIERKKLEAWSKQLEERETSIREQEEAVYNLQKSSEEKVEIQAQDVARLEEQLKHREQQLKRKEEEMQNKLETLAAREEEISAREEYVTTSEETLIEKAQANFELRAELEQREENIARREAELEAQQSPIEA